MKSIMYIGAALMIGAGIYGFVDYKEKSHSRELQSLYTKEKKKEVIEPLPAKAEPAVITVPEATEQKEPNVEVDKTPTPAKKALKKKKEKVNLRQFSRAALEKEMEETRLPEPASKEEQ